MDFYSGGDFHASDTCVVFGRFDGIHAGHRAAIRKAVEQKSRGLKTVLLGFDFRPSGLFGTDTLLYTEEEKAVLLRESGLDLFISWPFTADTKAMEAEDFVRDILAGRLGAKVIVAGRSCRFGKGGTGDVSLLGRTAEKYGCELIVVDMARDGGETGNGKIVTSELVREAIGRSDMDRGAALLGYPYTMIGPVVHGKALGRTAKLPTANIEFAENKLIPPHGIYATLTRIEEKPWRGLTIIGTRPTVDNFPYVTIETYLLDFSGDIYGKTIQLEIHAWVREIRKFRDLFEAKEQVDRDIESVREYLMRIR